MRFAVAALALAVACAWPPVAGHGGGHPHSTASPTHFGTAAHSYESHTISGSHTTTSSWVHGGLHGGNARDPRQLDAFKKQHPFPATGKTYGSCPGYIVDHVI